MPLTGAIAVFASAIIFAAVSIYANRALRLGRSVSEIAILVVYLLMLVDIFGWPHSDIRWRGSGETSFAITIAVLYAFMLAGMIAEQLYSHLDKQVGDGDRLRWTDFAKAALVSPMIFIPLVAALRENGSNMTKIDASSVMTFLVAFENGFLWKAYFGARLGRESKGGKSRGRLAHRAAKRLLDGPNVAIGDQRQTDEKGN